MYALLRASWGKAPPPTLPLLFYMLTRPFLNHCTLFESSRLRIVPRPFMNHCTLFESSRLRTSWGGLPPPPNPPGTFQIFDPVWNGHFFDHHVFEKYGGSLLYNATFYVLYVSVCLYVCTSWSIMGEATPANPPTAFLYSTTPFLESLYPL